MGREGQAAGCTEAGSLLSDQREGNDLSEVAEESWEAAACVSVRGSLPWHLRRRSG